MIAHTQKFYVATVEPEAGIGLPADRADAESGGHSVHGRAIDQYAADGLVEVRRGRIPELWGSHRKGLLDETLRRWF